MTRSNQDDIEDKDMPGSVRAAVMTVYEYSDFLLSGYGQNVAKALLDMRDTENKKLVAAAKELDAKWKE